MAFGSNNSLSDVDAGNIMAKNTFNLELLSDFVADTQIVSELADRIIVRAGLIDKKVVPTLQKAFEEKRFNNLCYIFNGVAQLLILRPLLQQQRPLWVLWVWK